MQKLITTILLLVLCLATVEAGVTNRVQLAWCPSPSAGVTNYAIWYGIGQQPGWTPTIYDTNSGISCPRPVIQYGSNWFRMYTNSINVGVSTNYTFTNLVRGATYYFSVLTQGADGEESPYSNEVEYTVPLAVPPEPPSGLSAKTIKFPN